MTIAPEAPSPAPLRFLSLEITSRCQLTCPGHCYAQAGPTAGHGTMTTDTWLRIIDEAAALGTTALQLIGGEPTLHPDFTQLARHAVEAGLLVRVYSNLVRVREQHWPILQHPNVRVATTIYSDDPAEHDTITGRTGSHAATIGNIAEALRRGLRPTVAVIDLGNGQRVEQARAAMTALGVPDVRVDRVRAVGNAARGALPSTAELCGRCGIGKAAILPDGTVAPCEIGGRFLTAGSVATGASLASVLNSTRWAETVESIPSRTSTDPCPPDCQPAASDSCAPAKSEPCGPMD
ncbi:radical SAM protein [Streptomyces sp. NPDC020875]|uniref:radical SAM protein n=1 Tax=Streptomyces sp. NPDC020875 TaxID=3154898 RepID=UPI0034042BC8